MKKGITLLLVLTLLVALAAPSAFAADETELIVFAAASMTETMNQIKELYEAENPGITLVYNFDSSGTLKTQIQEGADCDVFISAAPKQMNALDASASTSWKTRLCLRYPKATPRALRALTSWPSC